MRKQVNKELSLISIIVAPMFLVCAIQDDCIWAIIALTAYISMWVTVNLQKKRSGGNRSAKALELNVNAFEKYSCLL